jgi:uncharacterized membrane protein YkvA (DUF1232 family)
LYFAARHPETPLYAKIFVAGVVAYLFSPIDLIPDFIPVIGYLDDMILVPLGLAIAVKLIPPSVMAECRLKADAVGETFRKVSYVAAIVVIALWLAIAIGAGIWIYRRAFSK